MSSNEPGRRHRQARRLASPCPPPLYCLDMRTVYVESTVVGVIAARDHPDPVVFARQKVSRDWWRVAASRDDLVVSDLVLEECSAGDPTAAAERRGLIDHLPALAPSASAEALADALLHEGAIPASEPRDAAHLALAAVHGVDSLVTWNFKHLLNPHPPSHPPRHPPHLPGRWLRAAYHLHARTAAGERPWRPTRSMTSSGSATSWAPESASMSIACSTT